MSECLTDETLARFLDGRLTEDELACMHEHMDECSQCREFVLGLIHHTSTQEETAPLPIAGWTPPTEFDEFRLVRPLGQGAMGVVYLAQDTRLRRLVAVKFIASRHPEEQARERFHKEAQAIAQLQHTNVVTVFRIGQVGDHPYIVTEYLEGQTLSTLELPLPWRRALGLGVGLARGLEAAHAAGVLHRDLKPSNAFLTRSGEVKLLDFGLAEFVDHSTPGEPGLSRTVVGTPSYMAPELFQRKSATPQSDLYALGVVLYQLCTGKLPARSWAGSEKSPLEPARPSEDEGTPPLTEDVPGIDLDFASLIQRCLHVAPDQRYGSAEALRAALERLHVPEVRWEGNPYRGLASFEAEHRALFFGRDADIEGVLERLRRQPLVLIAGDSGIGKSSLCRAGILPRATQGALDGSRHFTSLTLQPGRRPLVTLAAALVPVLNRPEDELGAWLAEQPGRLGPALRALYGPGRGLLLFVDQLEELITLSEPAQAEHFARLLGELGELTVSSSGVRVLLAVRGDFLTRAGVLPGLDTAFERALYLLRPLSADGVREAIVGPARGRGVTFETAALQTLVEAMDRGSGSLPLLQFALAELWERRDSVRGHITQASLEAMGGVAGALSRHADAVLAPLHEAGQRAARQLLGLLITAEGTRGERSEEELLAVSPEAGAALRALVEGRLIQARAVGGRTHYELAHEALITSWGTLRRWLDEDVGQRALRQRLEVARAEWERLGHPEELLWRKRQLDEARALPAADPGSREQDFLRASWRAVRREELRRGLAMFLVVFLMGGLYGGLSLWGHLETQRFVGEKRGLVRAEFALGHEWSQRASAARTRALELFDPEGTGTKGDPHQRWAEAEELWREEALQAFNIADAAHAEAWRALEDILERVGNETDTHELRIQLTHERLLLAEEFHRTEASAQFLLDLKRLTATDPVWRERLDALAGLEIQTTPPGAGVELCRYKKSKGMWRCEPVSLPSPQTPIARLSLEAGSYHLRFNREGQAPVDLPLLLERGKTEQIHLDLPAFVPEGYVYIPPGCFLMGSNDPEEVRDFMRSMPMHKRCMTEGYLMGKDEVTLGDWMAYLDSGAATKEERSLLEKEKSSAWGALTLRPLSAGSWEFSLELASGRVLKARDDERLRYPHRSLRQEQDWRRFPLAGISAEEISGYLSWLNRTGRLPGARLCDEMEWVRAARGADDRRYPHGSRLEPDDANFDETYGRQPENFGPDEVGAHPAAVSPFGIHDMAGNVSEMVQPPVADLGDIVIPGGAWYFERIVAFIPNRQAFTATSRDVTVGVRLCASRPMP
ncbi:putative serine/threonine protein kinase [Cystobacter fuscus DSM 2262]|uniref:Serine/threonine protein kinase n=1 Tax=Cystobacter fuscus (strain ATCC 25194 / DSM 2262 / NBRC 100088 / M29) TaxID=1242864 RepID=S9R3I3_CYSF2|nr:bifunctional serine/threonine-protein kinase/formylglycine-generating enzyme family protein [Cystobacter fuscus]EPX63458.1 putative serine/threonine protein kinase [Cystobacter fuscus DSM 2262]